MNDQPKIGKDRKDVVSAWPRDIPRVAVLIVNYNAGEMLLDCLTHVSRQTWPSMRVIVLDNDSGDGSLELAEQHFPQYDYVRLRHNSGFAVANNRGIALAEDCEWIACLNPDAFPAATWLENLMLASQCYPQFDFFGSLMMSADEPDRLDGTGDIYHVSGAAWRANFHAIFSMISNDWSEVKEIFGPCAAAALYRRNQLVALGGFDERFFCYFEDVDLAFRLRLQGFRSAYVPQAVVRHKGSAITGYQSDFTVYHGHRNLEWTFFKNMPTTLLWIYLPQHLFLMIASVLTYTLRGKVRVILRAKRDALLGLPGIFRQRRQNVRISWRASSALRRSMSHGLLTPYFYR